MLLKYHVPASEDESSVKGVVSVQLNEGTVNSNAGIVEATGGVVTITPPDGTPGRAWVNYLDAKGQSSRNLHCVEWTAETLGTLNLHPDGHKPGPIKAVEPKKDGHSDHKKENTKV